jgi:hypothetical protein
MIQYESSMERFNLSSKSISIWGENVARRTDLWEEYLTYARDALVGGELLSARVTRLASCSTGSRFFVFL